MDGLAKRGYEIQEAYIEAVENKSGTEINYIGSIIYYIHEVKDKNYENLRAEEENYIQTSIMPKAKLY